MTQKSDKVNKAEPTGRSATFYAPLETRDDVQAIAQRVAQNCLSALERKDADAVKVTVIEAETKGGEGRE